MTSIHYIDSLFHPEDTAVAALLRILEPMFSNQRYSMVYVCFGGKFNDLHVEFKYPAAISRQIHRANYSHQMAPEFVRNKPYGNGRGGAISIVLDDFSDNRNRDCNMQIGNRIVDRVNRSNASLDLVLYHRPLTLCEFTDITDALVDLFSRYEIPPHQVLLANYVVFKRPNYIETESQSLVPERIQSVLESTAYSDCLYQWFGYNYYTYHLMYNYRRYSIWGTHTILARTFERTFGIEHITKESIERWVDTMDVPMIHFLENMVDISDPTYEMTLWKN
jgi:hypothetical protein